MLNVETLTPRRPQWPETARILTLVAAAIFVISPFLTSHAVGGVDARWYAYMLRGLNDQIASGHFPVPVGQGPFAWNGGVHPFRTAPVYLMLGGLWNILTFGALGTFTVQHLTVITSAITGALGFYFMAACLLGGRRWTAVALALIYLFAPPWLGLMYKADAYMSYMAFGALPLVLYGNARTVMTTDGRGYVPLGAGVALLWMCHPPIAMITTLATVVIQTGNVITRGLVRWREMAASAAVFAVLSAYYFASMSELPPIRDGSPLLLPVIRIVGLSLFFIGLGRLAFPQRRMAWGASALAGALVAGIGYRPWLCWILLTAGIWFALLVLARVVRAVGLSRHAAPALFLCALAGAAASGAFLGKGDPGLERGALNILASNTAGLHDLLRPIPKALDTIGIYQTGWTINVVIAAGALSLFGRRPMGAKLVFAVLLGLVICVVRVPLVSDFLVGYLPVGISSMIAFPLPHRVTPVIAGLAGTAAVLWYATAPASGRVIRTAANGALIAGVLWSGIQAAVYVGNRGVITSGDMITERNLRSENVMLDRYAYDLLPLPDYYTNGVTEPALESRLIGRDGGVLVGPTEVARLLEARTGRSLRLVCKPIIGSATWFEVPPQIAVEPGQHLVLRFEFDPQRHYNGYFVIISEHTYREYHIPDSGQPLAFGVGERRSDVLSLWNSGKATEHYRMTVSREPGNDLEQDGGFFANLWVSTFDASALPIRLESLIPYRATVTTGKPAWLETFLCFLPGYKAYVDNVPVPVSRSHQSLVQVPVPIGSHEVVVRFVGTLRLWSCACISGLGWAALLALWLRRVFTPANAIEYRRIPS